MGVGAWASAEPTASSYECLYAVLVLKHYLAYRRATREPGHIELNAVLSYPAVL
jgi:hypothetical protein